MIASQTRRTTCCFCKTSCLTNGVLCIDCRMKALLHANLSPSLQALSNATIIDIITSPLYYFEAKALFTSPSKQ